MSRSSLFYLITLLVSLVTVFAEVDAGKKPEGPVVCHGPRGPRGYRGRVGPRGETGAVGEPGADGSNAYSLSSTMDMIYLWSQRTSPVGPVSFQGYQMTTGFTVSPNFSDVTITTGGLYLVYFYIRDNMCYTEIQVNGTPLPILYNSFQVSGDQLWAQFALNFNVGDVVSFYSWEAIPFDQAQASIPQATGSIFYSCTMQLMLPSGLLPGKKA